MYNGINEFKNCYQDGTILVENQKGEMLANSHTILNSWKNYFCHLLNVHAVNDVRETEIPRAELLVPEPSL